MIALAFGMAGLLVLAVAFGSARQWIRRKGEYFVLPPGLRQQPAIDTETFPELEAEVRFDVNADGERGDDLPADTVVSIASLSGAGVSRKAGCSINTLPASAVAAAARTTRRAAPAECHESPRRQRVSIGVDRKRSISLERVLLVIPGSRPSSSSSVSAMCCDGSRQERRHAFPSRCMWPTCSGPSGGPLRLDAADAGGGGAGAQDEAMVAASGGRSRPAGRVQEGRRDAGPRHEDPTRPLTRPRCSITTSITASLAAARSVACRSRARGPSTVARQGVHGARGGAHVARRCRAGLAAGRSRLTTRSRWSRTSSRC